MGRVVLALRRNWANEADPNQEWSSAQSRTLVKCLGRCFNYLFKQYISMLNPLPGWITYLPIWWLALLWLIHLISFPFYDYSYSSVFCTTLQTEVRLNFIFVHKLVGEVVVHDSMETMYVTCIILHGSYFNLSLLGFPFLILS